MGRSIGAVFAGMVVWSVLWIGSNAALAAAYPDIIMAGQPLFHVPMLLTLIAVAYVAGPPASPPPAPPDAA